MSGKELSRRITVGKVASVALAVGLAGAALTNAAGNILADTQPQMALALNGNNAEALNILSGVDSISNGGDRRKLLAAREMARRSIMVQPLNPAALRVVGSINGMVDGPQAALAPMVVASRQSRRDFITQMWMMTRAVSQQELPAALAHFDAAARVSPEGWSILFPSLIYALNDPQIAVLFEPYMKEDSPYMGEFMRQAISLSDRPDVIAAIMARGNLPATGEFRSALDILTRKLVSLGEFNAVEQLYRSRRTNPIVALREARLTPETTRSTFTPIQWLLDTQNGASFDSSRGQGSPRIYVVLARGTNGLPASKYVVVRPGTYRFVASGEYLRPPAGAEFRWRVRCWQTSGFAIIWRSMPVGEPSGTLTADVAVPAGCRGAMIELEGKGPINDADAEYVVNQVSFDPVQ